MRLHHLVGLLALFAVLSLVLLAGLPIPFPSWFEPPFPSVPLYPGASNVQITQKAERESAFATTLHEVVYTRYNAEATIADIAAFYGGELPKRGLDKLVENKDSSFTFFSGSGNSTGFCMRVSASTKGSTTDVVVKLYRGYCFIVSGL